MLPHQCRTGIIVEQIYLCLGTSRPGNSEQPKTCQVCNHLPMQVCSKPFDCQRSLIHKVGRFWMGKGWHLVSIFFLKFSLLYFLPILDYAGSPGLYLELLCFLICIDIPYLLFLACSAWRQHRNGTGANPATCPNCRSPQHKCKWVKSEYLKAKKHFGTVFGHEHG